MTSRAAGQFARVIWLLTKGRDGEKIVADVRDWQGPDRVHAMRAIGGMALAGVAAVTVIALLHHAPELFGSAERLIAHLDGLPTADQ